MTIVGGAGEQNVGAGQDFRPWFCNLEKNAFGRSAHAGKIVATMKRRAFLRKGAGALAAATIVPRHVLGGPGYRAPSDKLNIAGIGIGGKGWVNLERAFNGGSDNIVALCDVDDRMAKRARKKWRKAPYYRDFRKLLDREGSRIDAVIVSTPDHMHAVQALAAMQSGKHVYVEKPLTHDIYEARVLTQAAERYRLVTQMGNQGSSGDDTRHVETWIQQGLIGEVRRVHVWTNRRGSLPRPAPSPFRRRWIGTYG